MTKPSGLAFLVILLAPALSVKGFRRREMGCDKVFALEKI
jgi:hypothetical protein